MKLFSKKLLTAAAVFTVLCGCADPNPDALKGTATVVVAGSETEIYEIDLQKAKMTTNNCAYDLLAYLNETQNLALEATDGAYGKTLNKVGRLTNGVDGKYIYVYTSTTTVTYDGKTLTSSGVNIGSMHIADGCIIYITLISF